MSLFANRFGGLIGVVRPLVHCSPGAGGEALFAQVADELRFARMNDILVLLLLDPGIEPVVTKVALETVQLGIHVQVEVWKVLVSFGPRV